MEVKVIGAGLAGVEAAWYLAGNGVHVKLYEQRPQKQTPAHKSGNFAELVCSNSLRAAGLQNAVGILKAEMQDLGSLVMESAISNEVPAGGALAVDRDGFSKYITEKVKNHPNIEVIAEEVVDIDESENIIIATGPLTSDGFAERIRNFLGTEHLSFFDAAAPIVTRESLDMDKVYLKSRYDKGEAAYLNAPMNKEEYERFYDALVNADCVESKDFEINVFEGCMPIEVMASRGEQTMLYGPLKPVGLTKPDGERPYAVVQLRQDNVKKTLYNLVGFQTHMTFPAQREILKLIPGLENVDIVRYGVMHRNTFINSPKALNRYLQVKRSPNIFFAGQITGVEGYVESASSGIYAGVNMLRKIKGEEMLEFPGSTAMGALIQYIVNADPDNFQPMNITFGIIDDLKFPTKKKERKEAYSKVARADFAEFLKENELVNS